MTVRYFKHTLVPVHSMPFSLPLLRRGRKQSPTMHTPPPVLLLYVLTSTRVPHAGLCGPSSCLTKILTRLCTTRLVCHPLFCSEACSALGFPLSSMLPACGWGGKRTHAACSGGSRSPTTTMTLCNAKLLPLFFVLFLTP